MRRPSSPSSNLIHWQKFAPPLLHCPGPQNQPQNFTEFVRFNRRFRTPPQGPSILSELTTTSPAQPPTTIKKMARPKKEQKAAAAAAVPAPAPPQLLPQVPAPAASQVLPDSSATLVINRAEYARLRDSVSSMPFYSQQRPKETTTTTLRPLSGNRHDQPFTSCNSVAQQSKHPHVPATPRNIFCAGFQSFRSILTSIARTSICPHLPHPISSCPCTHNKP